MAHHRITRTVLGPIAVAAVLTLGACGAESDDPNPGSAGEPTSSESSAETPDGSADAGTDGESDADADGVPPGLENVPDVVAEVNGEEVTKDELVPVYEARLQQALSAVQAGGEAPDMEALLQETADNLVDTELLAQEAEARGISVDDDDVDAELGELAEQYQLESPEALLGALEEQGATEEDVREQVRAQVALERLVEDEVGSLEPTEDRLRELYAEAKEQAGEQGGERLPPFNEVREQLEQRATSDELGKAATDLVAELRKDADITVNLE